MLPAVLYRSPTWRAAAALTPAAAPALTSTYPRENRDKKPPAHAEAGQNV